MPEEKKEYSVGEYIIGINTMEKIIDERNIE